MPLAYAKINLGLRVLGKRPDGYHELETVFHRIDLCDSITFAPHSAIEVLSNDPAAPGGEANICHKAAVLLRESLGVAQGVSITITKHIPVGAGLGGGSADGALVLKDLPHFWGTAAGRDLLRAAALQLGSDVPYFLGEGSAYARGRGETLEHFRLDLPFTILLCDPGIHISTAWAYSELHAAPLPRQASVAATAREGPSLKDIIERGMQDPALLAESLHNDFEPPVFARFPALRAVKETMLAAGALLSLMSGSGSSVYGLFAESEHAQACAARLTARGYRSFMTPPHFVPPGV